MKKILLSLLLILPLMAEARTVTFVWDHPDTSVASRIYILEATPLLAYPDTTWEEIARTDTAVAVIDSLDYTLMPGRHLYRLRVYYDLWDYWTEPSNVLVTPGRRAEKFRAKKKKGE